MQYRLNYKQPYEHIGEEDWSEGYDEDDEVRYQDQVEVFEAETDAEARKYVRDFVAVRFPCLGGSHYRKPLELVEFIDHKRAVPLTV